LTRVGSGQFFVARVGLGRVSHLWFGLEFGKFPLKTSNFSIFFPWGQKKLPRVGSESTRVKAGSASYLLRVKSKLGSGRVGSGQGPSLSFSKADFDFHVQIEKLILEDYYFGNFKKKTFWELKFVWSGADS